MHGLDVAIFHWINRWPEQWAPVFIGFSEGNKTWPVRILFLVVFVTCVWTSRLRRAAIVGVVAWLASDTLCSFLKSGFKVLRPSVELVPDVIVRVEGGLGYGTASAHAASTMAIATAFMLVDRRLGFVWLFVSLMTGLARINVGVHYPSQVLLGWCLGALVAFGLYRLSLRLWPEKPKVSESPQEAA
ncbi:MAG: phosphatase PAP2 family protein [Armatimonadetes bacterium]|nr:phosphatase PAP2 family protein [Armatimonadota bacterium]